MIRVVAHHAHRTARRRLLRGKLLEWALYGHLPAFAEAAGSRSPLTSKTYTAHQGTSSPTHPSHLSPMIGTLLLSGIVNRQKQQLQGMALHFFMKKEKKSKTRENHFLLSWSLFLALLSTCLLPTSHRSR